MSDMVASVQPELGVLFSRKEGRVINRSGGARLRGQVLMFDMLRSVATNAKIGDPLSTFAVGVQPTAAQDGFALYCLLLEDLGDGVEGKCLLWGFDEALYEAGQFPAFAGTGSGCIGGAYGLDAVGFPGAAKVIAYNIDTTSERAGPLFRVLFNGIYGLGRG